MSDDEADDWIPAADDPVPMKRGVGRPLKVNLEEIAHKRGYDSVPQLLHELYIVAGMSISEVAEDLHVGYKNCKQYLKKAGIQLRPQGGANYQKVTWTQELRDEVLRDGVTAVALRLGVDRNTVAWHMRKEKKR